LADVHGTSANRRLQVADVDVIKIRFADPATGGGGAAAAARQGATSNDVKTGR